MPLTDVARIRRFNRAIASEIGALDTSFLGRGRPLGVARALWTLGDAGLPVTTLREELGIDSGLLSRLLRSLEAEGLITVTADSKDGRRRFAQPTLAGRREIKAYERLSEHRAERMLRGMGPRAGELLAAMDLIERSLGHDRVNIETADPEAPESRACLAAYFDLLAQRIPDIQRSHVPDPDPEAEAYRPPSGLFLLARSGGRVVGCGCYKTPEPGIAEIKRLWVDPAARGRGIASKLMTALEDAARRSGLTALRLDTNSALTEAIALYRKDGWTDIPPFSTYPGNVWLGKPL